MQHQIIGAGPRIRKWRKAAGIKSYQLAKTLKVSQGSLSDIENGKSNPSAPTIVAFIKYTDIDWYWMLTGKLDYEVVGADGKTDESYSKATVVLLSKGCDEIIVRRED